MKGEGLNGFEESYGQESFLLSLDLDVCESCVRGN